MAEIDTPALPPVQFSPDLSLPYPMKSELQASLTYLAHKLKRPIVVRKLPRDARIEDLPVSHSQAVIWIPQVPIKPENLPEDWQRLSDADRVLAVARGSSAIILDWSAITRENIGTLVSGIEDVMVFEDDVPEELSRNLTTWLKRLRFRHIEDREYEMRQTRRQADQLYHDLIHAERKLSNLTAECEALRGIDEEGITRHAETQCRSVQELIAGGVYEVIDMVPSGAAKARTGIVVIDYEGVDVPMGRYDICIDEQEKIQIRPVERWEHTHYPHPHVSTDYDPCLGDVRASIGKLIGSMQMAEALQVLHSFLGSYNPDSAYEKLSSYAPDLISEDDEDLDPCEDCDERLTPYCIRECPSNDGIWGCSECRDYRSEYCYLECDRNADWTTCSPCDECEHDDCIGPDCQYHQHK